MGKKYSVLIVTLILAFVVGGVLAMAATPKKKAPVARKMEEPESLSQHYTEASNALAKKNFKVAALEVRRAEEMVTKAEANSGEESLERLKKAAHELEEVAVKLDKQEVVSEKELSDAFARAHLAMARDHHAKALEHMKNKRTAKAGYEMKMSAGHIQKAAKLSGEQAEDATVAEAREVGAKLDSGADVAEAKVSMAMDNLGKKIEALSQKLK